MTELAYALTIVFFILFLIAAAILGRTKKEQRVREGELMRMLSGNEEEAERLSAPPAGLDDCLVEFFKRSTVSKAILTQLYVAGRPLSSDDLFEVVSGATLTHAVLGKAIINQVLMHNLMPSYLVTLTNGVYSLTFSGKQLASKIVK